MSKNRALSGSIALGKGMALAATAAMFLQGCGGCSGFDVSALSLDGRVINYSKKLSEEPTPTAAIIYGKLSPKSSTAISGNSLNGEYKAIFKELDNIVDLADNDAQRNSLSAWSNALKANAKQKIEPLLIPATTDSGEAVKLANELVPLLKENGLLETGRATALGSIPDGLKGNFNQIYDSLEKSVGRLYQMAVVTANRLEQDKARQKVAEISEGLDELRTMFDERDDLIASGDREAAFNAVNEGKVYMRALEVPLNNMGTRVLAKSLKAYSEEVLTIFNGVLKTNFLDKGATAAIKAEIKPKYDALVAQATDLVQLATNYKQVEKTKDSTDTKLASLLAKAFSAKEGIAPVLGTSLDQLTDINHLTEALSRNDVVVLEDNDNSMNMVLALASSVASNVAQLYGLPDASNVVGPDHERISKDKVDFAMDDGQFDTYLKNLGEKIRAESLESGAQKNIYVVFADLYPKDAKVNLLIQGLAQEKGKVVIITKNLQNYKGELFSPHGLSLAETILVADEMFKDENLSVDRTLVSDRLARFYTAFGHVTLSNLTPVVKDVAAKLRDPRAKKDDKGIQAIVIGSLASKKIHVGAQRSVLLSDSVKDAEKNLREDPQYYQQAASGGGGRGHADVLLSEMASIKAERANAAALENAGNKAKEELGEMEAALKSLEKAVKAKQSKAATAEVKLLTALGLRGKEIENALDKIASTLDQCTIKQENTATEPLFTRVARKAFLNRVITATDILEGKVDIADINTKPSCLVFGEGENQSIRTLLVKQKQQINNMIQQVKSKVSTCSKMDAFASLQTCFKEAAMIVENHRKDVMGESPVGPTLAKGLLLDITKNIKAFPLYNQVAANTANSRSKFWGKSESNPTLMTYTPGGGPNVFGDELSKAPMNGYKMVNQHYYIRALLDIFGTGGGNHTIPLRRELDSYNFAAPAALATPNEIIQEAFKNFEDNDALIVKARRELNDYYGTFVENAFAQMIYDELVEKIYRELVVPFGNIYKANLLKISGTPEYKAVWDEVVGLTEVIKGITKALEKNFVVKGDGDAAPGDVTDLNDLRVDKVKELTAQLNKIGDAIIDAKLHANANADSLEQVFADFESKNLDKFINVFVDQKLKILPAVRAIYSDAFDIAKYNQLKLDGTLPSGGPIRNLPALRGGGLIKHPLDP